MKDWFWAKSSKGRLIESSLHILDGAIGFGLVTGVAVAAAIGQLILGVLLGVFACGVFFRMARRAKARRSPP
ncbi:hypothetical protein [Massilia pseudoviolaceinigra]|uniref:hypothetical protein n=1 Tax=Massilia pseudoviolaceinigra TaxID=3057165 RepID=UPI0027966C71|nr:hypothetical protein [Massilia sp. CCM 9206]MDQ1924788.1 hypothetical protein [Massilia sp. CCM 9206]